MHANQIDSTLRDRLTADLANCDREPIHIPSRIQPGGVLLACSREDLRIVQVSAGDTVERLAGRMGTDRKEERFRILNGLGPSDGLRAGDQVKIVTE